MRSLQASSKQLDAVLGLRVHPLHGTLALQVHSAQGKRCSARNCNPSKEEEACGEERWRCCPRSGRDGGGRGGIAVAVVLVPPTAVAQRQRTTRTAPAGWAGAHAAGIPRVRNAVRLQQKVVAYVQPQATAVAQLKAIRLPITVRVQCTKSGIIAVVIYTKGKPITVPRAAS